MSEPQSIAVIVNPIAGNGKRLSLFKNCLKHLKSLNRNVDVFETGRPGDGYDLARALHDNPPGVIVAAGGDGTVNEVARAMMGSHSAMAVIPLGTVNLLARELDLPSSAKMLAAMINQGRMRNIYPGLANGHLFLVTASIGFDADVVSGCSLPLKKIIGKGAYGWAALKRWIKLNPAPFTVSHDNMVEQLEGLLIAKGKYYAGSFSWARSASVFDEKLHACFQEKVGRMTVLRQIIRLVTARPLKLPGMTTCKTGPIDVTAPSGRPVQGDGDIIARTPVVFRVSETPLKIIVP